MALPLQEAQRIAKEIELKLAHWNFSARVMGSENEVVVTCDDEDGRMGFGWAFRDFANLTKGWSVSVMLYEGKPAIIIW